MSLHINTQKFENKYMHDTLYILTLFEPIFWNCRE